MDYRAIMRSQTEIGTAAARNAANRARGARARRQRPAESGPQFTRRVMNQQFSVDIMQFARGPVQGQISPSRRELP